MHSKRQSEEKEDSDTQGQNKVYETHDQHTDYSMPTGGHDGMWHYG